MAKFTLCANFLIGAKMKLEYAKNPVWVNAEQTMIDLVVKWSHFNEETPFTANQNDNETHGRALFAAAAAGEYGEVAAYIPPPPEPEPELNPPATTATPSSGEIPGSVL
jgi:hypothetical protein